MFTSGAIMLGFSGFFLSLARYERPAATTVMSGFPQIWRAFCLWFFVSLFTFLWMLLLIVPGIIAKYRYSQAYYILLDNPEIGALEAIRRSKEIMAGNKGRLFVLQLTFIGWHILSLITFYIGYLWLVPYMSTAYAHFYEDLRTKGAPRFPDYIAADPFAKPL
ncbi:DUF975 family protein [Paenibacillus sp. MMS18-CY102]|uniref:DUF975 family protein n=1 Tax=Paenibacillus sp. MMS18-CY102 TaxID=2682849 RepID=UPI001F4596E2|nr:DUF975 family protein [Paenibacillus sp. MMS18-CY102]